MGAPHSLSVQTDLVYREGSRHPKHRLDAYVPPSARSAVIFIHGGYWVSGDRRAPEHGTGLYRNVGEALARRGVLTVVPSYRLAPEVTIEGIVEDLSAAIRFTIARFDLSSLTVVGHSAGGHLAALLACARPSDRFAGELAGSIGGVGVLSGIWDVADMRASHDVSFNRKVTTPVFGSGAHDAIWSPMTRLDAGPEHWLVLIGAGDFVYMEAQAHRAHRRLVELGRDSTLAVIEGYEHLDVVRRFGRPGDAVIDYVAALAGNTTSRSG